MKAYSIDFRRRVLAMCDKGRTTREVARAFDVSESWVRRIKQVRREQGLLGPLPGGGRRHGHFDAARLSQLEGWLHQHPDATLEWLRARVLREMELRCSLIITPAPRGTTAERGSCPTTRILSPRHPRCCRCGPCSTSPTPTAGRGSPGPIERGEGADDGG